MAFSKLQNDAIYNHHGENTIVSAGAGSGKTAVLTERVVQNVIKGIPITRQLILTFTKAAANEMKERIKQALKDNKLEVAYNEVDVSYITTFDAFALSLIKKYNYVLNISDNIKILDKSLLSLKKKNILKDIFNELYLKKDKLFYQLLDTYTFKDDNEILKTIEDLDEKLNVLYDKDIYLNNYIKNFYSSSNINKIIDDYLILIKNKIKDIRGKLYNLSTFVDNNSYIKIETYLKPLFNANSYEDIKSYLDAYKSLPRLASGLGEEAKIIKENLAESIKILKSYVLYQNILDIQEKIMSTKEYIKIVIDIILELDKRLDSYKEQVNAYTFNDIFKLAIKLLEDDSIKESIKNTYQEILIDEYQDTSDIQDKLISTIRNNNTFMVGDIKQSIYGFRNANPKLFSKYYDAYNNKDGGSKIDLVDNYRSRKEITVAINKMFNLIMSKDIGGADYKDNNLVAANECYINNQKSNNDLDIITYNNDKKESGFSDSEVEIFTIAKDIQDKIDNHFQVYDNNLKKLRDCCYKDFAIILSASTLFKTYKKIFTYKGIPLKILKDEAITDNIDVNLIKNIYNLIKHIYDNNLDDDFKLSYISIARSYLFEMNDNDIYDIFKNNSFANTLIYQIASNMASKLNNITSKELYYMIIDDFDFMNKITNTNSIEDHLITIDVLNKMVNDMSKMGYTAFDFLNYLEELNNKNVPLDLSLNKSSSNTIVIMTIHGSKGLGFPICYYADYQRKFNNKDLSSTLIYGYKQGLIIPLMINNTSYELPNKILYRNIYRKEEIAERIRLLYVALTRAKEKIVIVSKINKDNLLAYKEDGLINQERRLEYNSFNDILNTLDIDEYLKEIDINNIGLTKDYKKIGNIKELSINNNILNVQECNYDLILEEESHFSKTLHTLVSKEEKENMCLGIRLHYLMEITDFNKPNYAIMNDFEKDIIKSFINTNVFANAISILKEHEFIYEENNIKYHGIIDLLLIFKDKAYIIDYKLNNIKDEAYIKQLQGYKNYIKELTKLPTETFLYSMLNKRLENISC